MIADQMCSPVSFLAVRVESRSRFAALAGHKTRRALAHRAFRSRRERTHREGRLLGSNNPLHSPETTSIGGWLRTISASLLPVGCGVPFFCCFFPLRLDLNPPRTPAAVGRRGGNPPAGLRVALLVA